MTKNEVIEILGEKYMITASAQDDTGNTVATLGYKSDNSGECKRSFINNRLKA